MLVEPADFQPGVLSCLTLGGFEVAEQQLEESGLADAIGPDNGNPGVHVDTKFHILKQVGLVRVVKTGVVQTKDRRLQL